ncbi:Serine protease gd [Frankliniella fusca]|uniref:Serine protease gd n=1 Tax=Frankliniella fusca TaxID=407009 RepID=A0AAE1HU29_9NEOP|nr:Serine protease gd [Frankliniella fusca]
MQPSTPTPPRPRRIVLSLCDASEHERRAWASFSHGAGVCGGPGPGPGRPAVESACAVVVLVQPPRAAAPPRSLHSGVLRPRSGTPETPRSRPPPREHDPQTRTMLSLRSLHALLAAHLCLRLCSCGPLETAPAAPMTLPLLTSRPRAMGVPMSPCPSVFRYERRGGGWAGVVTVPAPPTNTPLVLRVDLAIAAALTTKYAGTLQLLEGRRALLARLAAGDRRAVRYVLRFPSYMPLPAVTRVHAMGKDLCRGDGRGTGAGREPGVSTTISLEHSVRPEPVEDGPPPAPSASTTHRPPGTVQLFVGNDGASPEAASQSTPTADATAGEDGDDDDVCGRPVHHRLLVAGGGGSSPGDWPWLSAVFVATPLGLEYHCAGSLVSAGHVLTAAHCVHRHDPEALLVYLGRHNVRKWTEPQAQAREVAVVHVHPDHQAANYTADLAVLQLTERVEYDWFVRPVCIDWTGPEALGAAVGLVGTVVGWGRDEHGRALSSEPRAARLPIVSQEACLRSRAEFLHVTSERTFCAGFRNGTGPCNGDSGSGLVLPGGLAPADPSEAVAVPVPGAPWFLRGVVSLSLMDGERRTCDLRHYVVFTDVAKFRGWLFGIIRAPRRPGATSVRPPPPPPPAPGSSKQVEAETQTDLDDQPIWDSDPLPN